MQSFILFKLIRKIQLFSLNPVQLKKFNLYMNLKEKHK